MSKAERIIIAERQVEQLSQKPPQGNGGNTLGSKGEVIWQNPSVGKPEAEGQSPCPKPQEKPEKKKRSKPKSKKAKTTHTSEGDLDTVGLHIKDITRVTVKPELHKKLGEQIFAGQLALVALDKIAKSDLTTPVQQQLIKQLFDDNRAKFLFEQLKQNHEAVKGRLNKIGSNGAGGDHQKDKEFDQIVEEYVELAKRQLEICVNIDVRELKEQRLQEIIEDQVSLVEQSIRSHDLLVRSNLRLAVSRAKKYQGHGLELSELISYAEEGLMIAAARFDPRRGYQFSTYATPRIQQRIGRAIADFGSQIRLPVHIYETLAKLRRTQLKRAQEFGEEQNFEDLVCEFDTERGNLANALQTQQIVSVNKLVGENEDTEIASFLQDESQDLEMEASRSELKRKMGEVLAEIPPRERKVLMLRFGINDGKSRTLEEVGRKLGVTRERIRQIEAKALERLRTPRLTDELRPYLDEDPKVKKTTGAKEIGIIRPLMRGREITKRDEFGRIVATRSS